MQLSSVRDRVVVEHGPVPLGEAMVVASDSRQGRSTVIKQLSTIGFDVTALNDADTAWVHLHAWQYIRAEAPRVLLIDASPLCSAGRMLFARLAADRRFSGIPVVVLAGSDPLDAVIPGMVSVPLPCRYEQVTARVLRAVRVSRARAYEMLLRQSFCRDERRASWLPGSWEDEQERVGAGPMAGM